MASACAVGLLGLYMLLVWLPDVVCAHHCTWFELLFQPSPSYALYSPLSLPTCSDPLLRRRPLVCSVVAIRTCSTLNVLDVMRRLRGGEQEALRNDTETAQSGTSAAPGSPEVPPTVSRLAHVLEVDVRAHEGLAALGASTPLQCDFAPLPAFEVPGTQVALFAQTYCKGRDGLS